MLGALARSRPPAPRSRSSMRTASVDHFWSTVEDDRQYAQGDVLRSFPAGRTGDPTFGLVITADCDIVQSKAADLLTYVEVVTPKIFLERIWAPDQLQRYIKKQTKGAVQELGGVMRRAGLSYGLEEEQLLEWLRRRPVEAIEKAVSPTGKPLDTKLKRTLSGLRCALRVDSRGDALSDWCELRTMLGDPAERLRSDLTAAVRGGGDGGFPDTFLLPELPGATGIGYVALLRFIRTVRSTEVFTSEVDARVAGESGGLVRVGRLTDGIRFSITQKLAFLFSRIGLPSHFEDACGAAASLSAETIIPGA